MFFRKKNGDRRGRIGFIYFSLLELSVCNFCFLTMWISFLIKWMNKLINSFFRSFFRITVSTIQFSSVTQSCPTLCDPMNCSMPGLPVHNQLPESTQTHVHWVGDAIQPSHPLLSPSALTLSQYQGLFQWVSSSQQVAQSIGVSASTSVLPMNSQDWFPLGWTGWISLQSKGVFSNTTVQKHQFFGIQLSSQSNSHIHTWPLEKP